MAGVICVILLRTEYGVPEADYELCQEHSEVAIHGRFDDSVPYSVVIYIMYGVRDEIQRRIELITTISSL